ncbi:hypothetical protein B5E60_06645 [Alistipes sp. An116]|uniref:DUF3575 domain-containing protein n=1 Tax=Alistipes sp. An116 TaxID=1965546 RepID=UPI000B364B38|nr:DUF3575 domain-containing protein [Alistipes sp. An116]OUQ53575.1 hypothetical protein B5E60_06645 [Alistipes sp. An116]
MTNIRRILITTVLALVVGSLAAQEKPDTVYTFRFVTDKFYVPFNGNDTELARLEQCVERYRQEILAGNIRLHVDGWCTAGESEADNLAMAKVRSNRVKSELIVRRQLTEACFITRNHSGSGDYVTVRISVPKEEAVAQKDEGRQTGQESADTQQPVEEPRETEESRFVAEQIRADSMVVVHPEAEVPAETTGTDAEGTSGTDRCTLSLRANLLRWATLTPDLGLEWRITPSWGILVNGSWTSWSWNDKDRRYALWEVMPEVRRYMGREKRGYLGAMYKAGGFNYKFSATGKQGDLMGGGICGGYQLRLNKALSLDFNVAVGCLHADYETYTVLDGVRVRRGTESKNWWGPVNAGVTLIWKIY